MTRTKKQPLLKATMVRLEPATMAKLDALAAKTDRSRASLVRIAVMAMLEKHPPRLEGVGNG